MDAFELKLDPSTVTQKASMVGGDTLDVGKCVCMYVSVCVCVDEDNVNDDNDTHNSILYYTVLYFY